MYFRSAPGVYYAEYGKKKVDETKVREEEEDEDKAEEDKEEEEEEEDCDNDENHKVLPRSVTDGYPL